MVKHFIFPGKVHVDVSQQSWVLAPPQFKPRKPLNVLDYVEIKQTATATNKKMCFNTIKSYKFSWALPPHLDLRIY